MVTKNQLIENGTNAYCGPLYMAEQYAAGNCPLSSVQSSITNVMDQWADPAVEALRKIEGALTGIGDYVTEDILKITTEALKQYNHAKQH